MAITKFLARDLTIGIGGVAGLLVAVTTGAITSVFGTGIISTVNPHGLQVGQRIQFATLTGGTGLTALTNYWVISTPSLTTFTVSVTQGGAIAAQTTNITVATLTAEGSGYTQINGLTTLTHSPSSTDADTTDFNSNGFEEHMKAARGTTWQMDGHTLEDIGTGARDPGQLLCEQLGQQVGPLSIGAFRITSPGGNAVEFNGSIDVTLGGGANNDAATWKATIKVTGQPTFLQSPALT